MWRAVDASNRSDHRHAVVQLVVQVVAGGFERMPGLLLQRTLLLGLGVAYQTSFASAGYFGWSAGNCD